MSAEIRKLRRLLLIICIIVYLAGMLVLIVVAKGSPLLAITDVRYALGTYCCVIVTCIFCMVLFSRRVSAAIKRYP
jgi:hypothetical protein